MLDGYMAMLDKLGAGTTTKLIRTGTSHLMTAKSVHVVNFCKAMLFMLYNDERVLSDATNLR